MRNIYLHIGLILAVIVILTLAILPPEEKLRRGKDLAGGSTLVYQVDVRPTDPIGTIDKVKDLIKKRLDPSGLLEIDIVTQGTNRIEISMPLPNRRVQTLKREFEAEIEKLGTTQVRDEQLSAILELPEARRKAELDRITAGDPERQRLFAEAATTHDLWAAARATERQARPAIEAAIAEAQVALDNARKNASPPEAIAPLEAALRSAEDLLYANAEPVAKAELAFEQAKTSALRSVLSAAEMRRVLELPDTIRKLQAGGGKVIEIPSPRAEAIKRLRLAHPGANTLIDSVIGKWNTYQAERKTLDDPADVRRLLRSAGVLDFRITAKRGEIPDEARLRAELRASGPRGVRSTEARWFKLNKLDGWLHDKKAYDTLAALGPAAYFGTLGYVVEEYDGEYYMLAWDLPGLRLTQAEGNWAVTGAGSTIDQIGKPAINFNMDVLGASKLGDLTTANIQRQMAVLLDDQVYTAPTLQGRITNSGLITGEFTQSEIDYIVRVLAAGSMAAKLSPEPVSESTVGPELGADNLARGLRSGVIAFAFVAAIMVVYYFGCGMVAVFALFINGLLILGLMALNHAAFSLPGIAGVVLTFGMTVDANVLIYERMREEMERGADFRNAVRLGYARALPSIVDGNVTVLIVCIVLAFTGTQEIKGFAITMIIGSITTFFTQLYVTRVIFHILVEMLGWRSGTMLAIKIPAISRAFYPKIDWMKYRPYMLGLSALLVISSVVVVAKRGIDVFDNDFRGGTKVTVQLKADSTGKPTLMHLDEARERFRNTTKGADFSSVPDLAAAEVLAINPDPDNRAKSSRFTIKTVEQNTKLVQEAVLLAFKDVLDEQPPVKFAGMEITEQRLLPIKPITEKALGDNIDRPAVRTDVAEFVGGGVIILDQLEPRPTLTTLEERLRQMRNDPLHTQAASRTHRWVILGGDENAISSAALLVRDDAVSFLQDPDRWAAAMKSSEWKLVLDALSRSNSLAGVESFSASIAQTFVAQAITSVLLSCVLIIIYIWLRFQSFRYSIGAICSTLHDCAVATGALAACGLLVERYPQLAQTLGIEPFKIDLNVVAAVLTILGYSLNDTVIVMDRIRETKGKNPFATRAIINDAVNSTISRTIMTAGLTMVATIVLFIFGGEAIRPFAFTFMIGVLTGTYSSIFIAAPLVWVKSKDQTQVFPARAASARA
ncbi:MAG: protein translocase subunit SecD [bacterium]